VKKEEVVQVPCIRQVYLKKEVATPQIQRVDKNVDKSDVQLVEKRVEVPCMEAHEQPVERWMLSMWK